MTKNGTKQVNNKINYVIMVYCLYKNIIGIGTLQKHLNFKSN